MRFTVGSPMARVVAEHRPIVQVQVVNSLVLKLPGVARLPECICSYRERSAWALLFLSVVPSLIRAQDAEQDIAIFTSADWSQWTEFETANYDNSETTPRLDFVYSRMWERFKIFGEFLITDEEKEVERFQLGWRMSDETNIWIGRFHHSGSYWNTEFHHGQFLQTSITRPSIEEFGDHGGALPAHVTGLLIEQREEFDSGAAMQISLSIGVSGRLGMDGLESFDIVDPESGYEPAVNARVAFFLDALGESQFGVSLGKHNIGVERSDVPIVSWDPTANEIELETFGMYGDWRLNDWRILGSAIRASARSVGGVNGGDRDFTTSYVQAEYDLGSRWRLFGRVEHTSGDESYLDLFPRYVRRQSLLGVRWSLGDRHALTFEGTNSEAHQDHFHKFSVQWSAVFR